MPLSQGLKFLKKILKEKLENDGENIKKIKLKNKNSFTSLSIQCDNKTATLKISKKNVAEIIKNTKEEYSLNYIVKNIEWRNLPL